MKEDDVHIRYVSLDIFPNVLSDEELNEIKQTGLKFEAIKTSPTPYAALEWIIPGAFAVYLAKPYFDGFLNEAGKDHYDLLKKFVKRVAKRSHETPAKLEAASQSTDKLSTNYFQSAAFSLYFTTFDDKDFKVLLDEQLTAEEWATALEKLLDMLIENYENNPDDLLSKRSRDFSNVKGYTHFAIIDTETKEWIFLDGHKHIKKLIMESEQKK